MQKFYKTNLAALAVKSAINEETPLLEVSHKSSCFKIFKDYGVWSTASGTIAFFLGVNGGYQLFDLVRTLFGTHTPYFLVGMLATGLANGTVVAADKIREARIKTLAVGLPPKSTWSRVTRAFYHIVNGALDFNSLSSFEDNFFVVIRKSAWQNSLPIQAPLSLISAGISISAHSYAFSLEEKLSPEELIKHPIMVGLSIFSLTTLFSFLFGILIDNEQDSSVWLPRASLMVATLGMVVGSILEYTLRNNSALLMKIRGGISISNLALNLALIFFVLWNDIPDDLKKDPNYDPGEIYDIFGYILAAAVFLLTSAVKSLEFKEELKLSSEENNKNLRKSQLINFAEKEDESSSDLENEDKEKPLTIQNLYDEQDSQNSEVQKTQNPRSDSAPPPEDKDTILREEGSFSYAGSPKTPTLFQQKPTFGNKPENSSGKSIAEKQSDQLPSTLPTSVYDYV